MFDILATLCLLGSPDVCVERVVPVGASDCAGALSQAKARLDAWKEGHVLSAVTCGRWRGDSLELTEIASGVFVHAGKIAEPSPQNRGDLANIVIVVGENAVAVVDSGGSRDVGEAVVASVRSLTELPVMAVILTHMHPDHVFGATALADAGAVIIGHAALPEALASRGANYKASFQQLIGPAFVGTETPAPDRMVETAATLDLGGRILRIVARRTAHTATDLTVFDEATGTLIAGDLVFDTHAPALDGSLRGWQALLEGFDASPPQRVVPGHGASSVSWPEGGAPLRRYLDVLAEDTREAIDAGETLSEAVATVAASEKDEWTLFDLYNPRNATVAYTELEWE